MAHAGSLSAAAATGDLGQIHTMVANGEFIDERDTHLNTPLHHACLAGHRPAVELLLSYGAEVNAENKSGASCLHYAAHSGDNVIISRLIEAGADVTHQSYDGKTALHSAVANDFPDAARLLIEAGCLVDVPENEGNTALHKATQKDFPVCVELLRSYGANQYLRNAAGKSAVDLARENGLHEVLDALVSPPLPRSYWEGYDYDFESSMRESQSGESGQHPGAASLITQVQRPPRVAESKSTDYNLSAGSGTFHTLDIPQTVESESSVSDRDVDIKSMQQTLDELFANPGVPHRTRFAFTGSQPDELSFEADEAVLVLKHFSDGWCLGERQGIVGMFPAKYALLQMIPRHTTQDSLRAAAAVPKPVIAHPHAATSTVQPAPLEKLFQNPVPEPVTVDQSRSQTRRTITARQATSVSEFSRSNATVVTAHKAVCESEGLLLAELASIEKVRRKKIEPFLDSVPTMAAAAVRAYDTALRSVQLLSQMLQSLNGDDLPVVESDALSETLLGATSAWVQAHQGLADNGKVLRESLSVGLSAKNVEMSRLLKSVHRAMVVYGRMLAGMVATLEKAHLTYVDASTAGDDATKEEAAMKGLEDRLVRAVAFVTQRHGSLVKSLQWHRQDMMATLAKGWCEWSKQEQAVQEAASVGMTQLSSTLQTVVVPETPKPASDWEEDLK